MKVSILVLALFLLQTSILSQTLPEWDRVYTFDDKSIIELNTDYVMFSTDKTSRVRFRWTFVDPQKLGGKEKIEYQSSVSEYQFDCENRRFRMYSSQYFDPQGKMVHSIAYDPNADWRSVRSGKVIQILFAPACKLIDLRRREPALER